MRLAEGDELTGAMDLIEASMTTDERFELALRQRPGVLMMTERGWVMRQPLPRPAPGAAQ